MVYYEHGTTPIIFGFTYVLYYAAIPLSVLAWFALAHNHIRKGNYRPRLLAVLLLAGFAVTSLSGAMLVNQYLYIHSPVDGTFCPLAPCDGPYRDYVGELNFTGPAWVYVLYDTGPSYRLGIERPLRAVAVVRPLLLVPAVEVRLYDLSGRHLETFYIIWPRSPGGVLSERLDFRFTVLIVTGEGS